MKAIYKSITLSTILTLLLGVPAMAAETASTDSGSNINMGLYTLVGLIIILLFVVGMLAHTLIQLTLVAKEKERKDKAAKATGALLLLLLLAIPGSSFAGEPATAAAASTSIGGISTFDFYLLMIVIGLELLAAFSLATHIHVLLKVIKGAPEKEESKRAVVKKSWFWDKFNAAATEEKEHEILLDHNYDGIQELDNSLPPWWKYGFYLTIVVAFVYMYRFHISHDGPSQQDEYAAEMQQGEEDKTAYLAISANNVDETNVKLLTDAAALSAGKELFVKTCAACHLADGGGNVGPNLTDEYWLHGGGIKEIFKSIKYGWQDKGMKSWKDDLSPVQIQQLASFIRSIKGSHPATPKAPQGDMYAEVASTASAPASDSTTTK